MTDTEDLRILFVVPYAPSPVRVRSYNFVRALLRAGAKLTLATLWETEAERADIDALSWEGATVVAEPLGRARRLVNLAGATLSRMPLQSAYCWQPALARALDDLLSGEHFDVIHVEHLRGAAYGLRAIRADGSAGRADRGPVAAADRAEVAAWDEGLIGGGRPPVVWDSVDCISHLFAQAAAATRSIRSRLMTAAELGRTRRHEARLVRAFSRTLVTSQVDRQALLGLPYDPPDALSAAAHGRPDGGGGMLGERIRVVPNGVDTAYFAPAGASQTAVESDAAQVPGTHPGLTLVHDATRPPAIVVTGKMSYHANVTMVLRLAEEVMPLVWRERPDAGLWIVGKDPPPAVRRWATTSDTSPPSAAANHAARTVVVTGAVPDMRLYLQAATVSVAPVAYGAGIQNKVLEAMACAVPVVASPQAVSALPARPGRDVLVADDDQAFAREVLDLLADPTRRAAIGRAGRAYVEAHHSWDAAAERLIEIYRGAATMP